MRLRSGSRAPDEKEPIIWTPKAVTASSMLDPATPQGSEGASSTNASTGVRRATSWATRPPMEWPISTGGSGKDSQSAAISAA